MKSFLLVFLLINAGHSFLNFKKQPGGNNTDHRVFSNVKIYSNLAEIIVPLGKLPLEFSEDDWRDIRADSVTLVGANVTITEQTITEKKQSLNNAHVYVRAPSSSNTETKFIRATMIDEKRNLVKLIDKDVSKDPIYFTPSSDQIVHESNPPQSKYYVDFKYGTTDAVFLSYIRSNLNWKTRYQLNMFGESKTPILIAMADIRNDGQSRVDIDHADLLGGDINLQANSYPTPYFRPNYVEASYDSPSYAPGAAGSAPPKVRQAEEIAGLYVFSIDKAFSIEPKTNYALPMFRPTVKIESFASITKQMYNTDNTRGKAQRSYRLTADRYLSNGNVVIREYDHLVGETVLPGLAAKNSHEFSIGEEADVTYRENVTVISARASSPSRIGGFPSETRKESTISITVTLKNFKKNRPIKVEYKQTIYGQSIKLTTPNAACTQDSMSIKCSLTLAADEEKAITYKFDQVV